MVAQKQYLSVLCIPAPRDGQVQGLNNKTHCKQPVRACLPETLDSTHINKAATSQALNKPINKSQEARKFTVHPVRTRYTVRKGSH
jgi:hypothetical protein